MRKDGATMPSKGDLAAQGQNRAPEEMAEAIRRGCLTEKTLQAIQELRVTRSDGQTEVFRLVPLDS